MIKNRNGTFSQKFEITEQELLLDSQLSAWTFIYWKYLFEKGKTKIFLSRHRVSLTHRTIFEKIKLPIFCSTQLLGVFFKSVFSQNEFLQNATLNILCLLSSTACAALPFDSGRLPVCMVRSCGVLSCSVLYCHHCIHSSCELQKEKKMPHLDQFPRPGEIDPYVHLSL